MRLPVRLRLTLASALSMALLLGATGAFLYVRLGTELLHSLDSAVRAQAIAVQAGIGQQGTAFGDAGGSAGQASPIVQILTQAGRVLESSEGSFSRPLVGPRALGPFSRDHFLQAHVPAMGGLARILVHPAAEEGRRLFVVIAASLTPRGETLGHVLFLMFVLGPAALGLTTFGAWVLAGAALRPVERIRRDAAAISASDRGRLLVPETNDEVARLATTLNGMLDRLQRAYERERRFVSEASHELRTPLAILKAELELCRSRAGSPDDLRQTLDSAAEETERLVALAGDLLVLSRMQDEGLPVNLEMASLRGIMHSSCAPYREQAAARAIALREVAEDAQVMVDPRRIRQALENLMRNSLRFADPGGSIEVRGSVDGRTLVLTVDDSGPGFSDDMLSRAFEPFTRGAIDRAESEPGAGLGLAIVHAVALAHHGVASVANRPQGGARVTLRVPARATEQLSHGSRVG